MYHGWTVWSVACCRDCCDGKGSFRTVVFALLLEAMHSVHHAVAGEEQDRQYTRTYDVTLRRVRATVLVVQMQ